METKNVTAAIIEKDDKILIGKRLSGEFEGHWEFPGGKYEAGETGEQAIIREIREEFNAKIEVEDLLCTVEHQYSDFYLIMDCFICRLLDDQLILHNHSAIRWIDPYEENIDFLPADEKVIKYYKQHYLNS